jgi:hypothetical protein
MGLKVAVIGLSESCAEAPWDDPEWEKWGLPWHGGYWARMTRLFEIHAPFVWKDMPHVNHMRECWQPLYMQECYEGFPATRYPLEEVIKTVGRDYFTSSVAYMTAYAIHKGAEEIALYGVDINENQYGYQRPCIEYLLGFAQARGIKVSTQKQSALFTYVDEDAQFPTRYGYAD